MNTHINIRRRLLKSGIAALAVMTFTGAATAQDTFEVRITHPKGVSVEASYVAMEKQAQKYCKRETRRVSNRGLPSILKTEYIRNCVDEVMGNVVSKIKDQRLIAYHEVKNAERTSVAANSYHSTK